MKYKCILLICFGIFIGSVSMNAQFSVEELAKAEVLDLDEKLVFMDPSTALSEEQQKLILQLFTEKIAKAKKIRESIQDPTLRQSELDQLYKQTSDRLHNNILSRRQREAKFDYQKLKNN